MNRTNTIPTTWEVRHRDGRSVTATAIRWFDARAMGCQDLGCSVAEVLVVPVGERWTALAIRREIEAQADQDATSYAAGVARESRLSATIAVMGERIEELERRLQEIERRK